MLSARHLFSNVHMYCAAQLRLLQKVPLPA